LKITNFLNILKIKVSFKFIKTISEKNSNILKKNLIENETKINLISISRQLYDKKCKNEELFFNNINDIVITPKLKILILLIEYYYNDCNITIFSNSIPFLNFLNNLINLYFNNKIKVYNFNGSVLKTISSRNDCITVFNNLTNSKSIFLLSQKLGVGFNLKSPVIISLGNLIN
jgi:hypothetical protein